MQSAGFTLTELMAVLVIVGILSALALPSMGRDRKARIGSEYAQLVMRELQRARVDAVSERLAQRVYLYGDRVEVRSAVASDRPGQPPRDPALTDPPVRTVLARPGVHTYDVVTTASTPGSVALDTVTYRAIEFNSRGQAQFVGHPALTPAFLYIANTEVDASHPDARFRIDVQPLTARALLRTGWQ